MEAMAGPFPNGRYLDCPNGSHLAMRDDAVAQAVGAGAGGGGCTGRAASTGRPVPSKGDEGYWPPVDWLYWSMSG